MTHLVLEDEVCWLEGQGGEVELEAREPVQIVGTTRQIPEPEDA